MEIPLIKGSEGDNPGYPNEFDLLTKDNQYFGIHWRAEFSVSVEEDDGEIILVIKEKHQHPLTELVGIYRISRLFKDPTLKDGITE